MTAGASVPADPVHVENLRLILNTVEERYGDVIDAQDHAFIRTFEHLPPDARNLFARLLCRSAPVFRVSRLNYPDIADMAAAVATLADAGCLERNPRDIHACLHITPGKDLQDWFGTARRLRKPEQVAHLLEIHGEEGLLALLWQRDDWVAVNHRECFGKLQLCFFGNRHQDISEFAITGLGHVVYENYELSDNTRYFHSRDLLDNSWRLAQLQNAVDAGLAGASLEVIRAYSAQIPDALDDARYTRRRARLMQQLGREAERRAGVEDAERLYLAAGLEASHERLARIYLQCGDVDAARALLEPLRDQARDPDCRAAAQSLLQRMATGRRALRKGENLPGLFQPDIQTLTLPLGGGGSLETGADTGGFRSIEEVVAGHFRAQGAQCFYVENLFFNGLLGLLFWDILFQPVPGAFANRFQRAPLDLYEPEFRLKRDAAIQARLAAIAEGKAVALISQCLAQKTGLANTFVHWEFFAALPWQDLLAAMPAQHLCAVLSRMLDDPARYCAGLPDLFCLPAEGGYCLLEVKGPNDKLRENQRDWLAFFAAQGIFARVVQVVGDSGK